MTYNRGNKTAFYVQTKERRFIVLNGDGSLETTSCPHAATLFTSEATAYSIAKQIRESHNCVVDVFHTRTHNPNVIVGALK